MSALHYIVSQQCPIYGGEWAERAAFRWFADARAYALRTSKADIDDRFVRVEREGFEPNYFLRGQAADHLYEEDMAA
jgi:hypothetical protein